MRVGLMAFSKTNNKLMENRRVAGAQRVVQEELEGMMPVVAPCGDPPGPGPAKTALFEGQPQTMRLVSTFSLQQGWRGPPQILELFVIPGEDGRGVRLVVNEIPYTGPAGTALLCTGQHAGPANRRQLRGVRSGPSGAELLRAGRQTGLLPVLLLHHPPGPQRAAALDAGLETSRAGLSRAD